MSSLSVKPLVLLVLATTLAGCNGDVRRQLGLDRAGPDAFAVVSRAPLEMPPDFGLRPPQPGAGRPNEVAPRDQARGALFGDNRQSNAFANRSSTEANLLKSAGADRADPNIRDVINREAKQTAEESRTLVDSLIFWRDPTPPGTVVDAPAEAARLGKNATMGDAPTTGTTPVITRKSRGILEGLF